VTLHSETIIRKFIDEYKVTFEGNVVGKRGNLKPFANNCHMGYLKVKLYSDGGKSNKTFLLHRLIWTYFNGDIPEGMQIDHIDGNHLNNHLDNLQVITQKENIRKRPTTHLTLDQVESIKPRVTGKLPYGELTRIAKEYNVPVDTIKTIRKGL